MARKVFVSGDMAADERLIDVDETSAKAALLWPWLLTAFDDWGRAEAQPKRLKATTFPMNDLVSADDIAEAISLYAEHGLVNAYEVNGKPYMAIEPDKWFKYQTHIRKEKREKDDSRHPAPVDLSGESRDCAHMREEARDYTPSPPPSPSSPQVTSGGSAGAGDEESDEPEAAAASEPSEAEVAQVHAAYEEHIGGINGPMSYEALMAYLDDGFEPQALTAIFEWAGDRKKRGLIRGDPWPYTASTLDKLRANKMLTLAAWESDQAERLRIPEGRTGPAKPDPAASAAEALAMRKRAKETGGPSP